MNCIVLTSYGVPPSSLTLLGSICKVMAMATTAASSVVTLRIQGPQQFLHHGQQQQQQQQLGFRRKKVVRTQAALVEASQAVQAAPDLTWQIWAGAIAGVSPFVVAGIEFSKRIAAQQRCSACAGSGLVKKSGTYFRCGKCGGFLPWYSWRRFFKG